MTILSPIIDSIKTIICQLGKSLLHVVYPSKCLHCHHVLDPSFVVICSTCRLLLEPINPDERCPTCFNEIDDPTLFRCTRCLDHPSLFVKMGAVFDYEGPSVSLVKSLKYAKQVYLAKGMGAYLYTQFYELNWPLPDFIVPVPLSSIRRFNRGFNQSEQLAQGLSYYLQRPIWKGLKRKNGDFSQASLSYQERQTLETDRFYLQNPEQVKYKTCLLIDDVMTTGTTLKKCAEQLIENQSGVLYALTFCRTLPD